MYRNLFGLLAFFAGALVLVGLTFSGTAEERADFVFNNGAEPKSLDPHKMTGQPEGRLADALFEGLTFNDTKTLKPVPGSAESWEATPDGKRWTFRLRPNARWTNGDPVTAHDFVWSWKRLQEPKTTSQYAGLMHMVRHAEAFNTYRPQVEALRKAGGVLAAFDELLARHREGLPAAQWSKFLHEQDVLATVIRTPDPVLQAAFGRESGTFAPDEATAIGAALRAEAARREEALRAATDHFGVDEGVFAPDDRTFVVELNAYTPYFLDLTAFYVTYPVHRETVEHWPQDWFKPGRIVSNGPFRMDAWTVNQRIRMSKSPTYWGNSEVHLRTVDALPYDNNSTAFNLYMTGDVDWLTSYPPDLIDVLRKRPDYHANPGMIVYFYRFNTTRRPFSDARVRRALCMSVDRDLLVETVTRKGEVPTTTIVAHGVPRYESPESALGYDPEAAKRLMSEAGYPEGRGFPKFNVLYNTNEGHKKVAEFVANQWRTHLGIEANPANEEWQSLLERVRRLDYDVQRAGWIGDYRDPNTFLDLWTTKNGNNETGWGNPFYDRLIALAADPLRLAALEGADREGFLSRLRERPRLEAMLARLEARDATPAARLETAAEARLQLFREAESILVQDAAPIMPFYFYVATNIVHPRVDGFYSWVEEDDQRVPNLQDIHPFRDVRMKAPPSAPPRGSPAR